MCIDSQDQAPNPAPGLYVVATPIGNRADLSPRARWLFEAANVIAAEDTRSLTRLLGKAPAHGRLVSLTEHNVEARMPELLEAASHAVVALVSEAGTPAIADPGTRLVAAAHDRAIPIFAIPGASALAAALSVSGFNAMPSVFLGFLPRRAGDRSRALSEAATVASTIVFFESPRRLSAALQAVAETLADPQVVVCRELTKVHEEVVRGPASELSRHFSEARGECTVVVNSADAGRRGAGPGLEEVLAAMKRSGARRSQAAGESAKLFHRTRADAYSLWDDV